MASFLLMLASLLCSYSLSTLSAAGREDPDDTLAAGTGTGAGAAVKSRASLRMAARIGVMDLCMARASSEKSLQDLLAWGSASRGAADSTAVS